MIARAVAVLGEPASGKTSITEALLPRLGLGLPWKSGLLEGLEFPARRLHVLGVYDGRPFGGPDRLSMAVQKDARLWLRDQRPKPPNYGLNLISRPDPRELPWMAYFEGDRLGGRGFLEGVLSSGAELRIAVLRCAEEVLEERHRARGDSQPGPWLRGRRDQDRRSGRLSQRPSSRRVAHQRDVERPGP